MNLFSWLWIAWGLAFLLVEGAALVVKDRPEAPRTLTANVRWLVSGAGRWHVAARVVLVALLAWLPGHFGVAAFVLPRFVHRWWAHWRGYFWVPCPRCGDYFGGHEFVAPTGPVLIRIGDDGQWPTYKVLCPSCTRAGHVMAVR